MGKYLMRRQASPCSSHLAMSTVPLRVQNLIIAVKYAFYTYYTNICFKGCQDAVTKRSTVFDEMCH